MRTPFALQPYRPPCALALSLLLACGDEGSGGSAADAGLLDAGGADSAVDAEPDGGGADGSAGDSGSDGGAPAPQSDHGTFGSGTRLRARYWDGGDGAVRFRVFHDTQLDMECEFRDRGDGRWFCYPVQSAGYRFADAECTEPVADWLDDTIDEGDFVYFGFRRTCDDLGGAYEVGPAETVDAFYRAESGDRCVSSSGGSRDLPVLRRVDDGTFVEATARVVGSSDGVRAMRLEAADGAFVNVALADAVGDACQGMRVAGSERCVPLPVPQIDANGSYFHTNDTCTAQEAAVLPFNGQPVCYSQAPQVVFSQVPGDGCTVGEHALFEAGAALADDSGIWLGSEGSCEPASTSDVFQGLSYWGVGAAVSGDMFAEIGVVARGEGALRVEHVAAADGEALLSRPNIESWRTQDGAPCDVTELADGTLRCLSGRNIPFGPDPISEWSDPECSVPLDVRSTACGEAFDYFFEYDDANALVAVYEAVVHTGPVYYEDGGGCTEVADLTDWGTVFALGDEVPLTSFPAVIERED